MKLFTKLKALNWWCFFSIYLLLYFFAFNSTLITIDEYEGGNRLAEFGTTLFEVFSFPLILVDYLGIELNSKHDILFTLLFVINFLINSILITTVINLLYLKSLRILKRVNR